MKIDKWLLKGIFFKCDYSKIYGPKHVLHTNIKNGGPIAIEFYLKH